MKILQINTCANSGSHGRIAVDIGKLLINQGHQSFIAFGRGNSLSQSQLVKIGTTKDIKLHALYSRLFDRHGFGSTHATKLFIQKIRQINPDLIHLHNLHGYYLNIKLLFQFLYKSEIPVVWTFHDCWPFTGHCSFFDFVGCDRWKTMCYQCPNKHKYPTTLFLDQSTRNYKEKRKLFHLVKRMVIVTPSQWLANLVKQSYLSGYPVKVINNGVDIESFKPFLSSLIKKKYGIKTPKMILGIASIWDKRKGFFDFIQLRKMLANDISIVLVGLKESELKRLPQGIIGIKHTESIEDLSKLYSSADIFVNPTYVDNFPSTNIESLACGTPLVTYNTGGSPEAIDKFTGTVIEKGDINSLANAIHFILRQNKKTYSEACRQRAVHLYDSNHRYQDYINLYNSMIA